MDTEFKRTSAYYMNTLKSSCNWITDINYSKGKLYINSDSVTTLINEKLLDYRYISASVDKPCIYFYNDLNVIKHLGDTVLIKEELVYINLLAERIYKYDKYETNKTK